MKTLHCTVCDDEVVACGNGYSHKSMHDNRYNHEATVNSPSVLLKEETHALAAAQDYWFSSRCGQISDMVDELELLSQSENNYSRSTKEVFRETILALRTAQIWMQQVALRHTDEEEGLRKLQEQ